jgi:hypothetical protein
VPHILRRSKTNSRSKYLIEIVEFNGNISQARYLRAMAIKESPYLQYPYTLIGSGN